MTSIYELSCPNGHIVTATMDGPDIAGVNGWRLNKFSGTTSYMPGILFIGAKRTLRTR